MNSNGGDTLNFSTINVIVDFLGTPAINSTSNTECSPQNLLDTAFKTLTQTLKLHRPRNLNDLIKRNIPTVLDVLLLLTITRGFLERSNDK